MADEKRRLIYELLVEAKGAGNAKDELAEFSDQLGKLGGVAKGAFGILAAGFALKGIGEALDEMTKFNQAMAGLGVTGKDAAAALGHVQDTAFTTMNSIAGVTDVYKEAVQLQQQLGRSTEDAARTTDAFIRIANAEGKSTQQAAQAVNLLSFALERGQLPAKEFTRLLRDSPTFARAAQEALGLTTQQLADMAKQGDLGAASLTRIVLQMEKIGEDTDTAATVGGIVDALKVLSTTIVQATAEGAGFNATIGRDGITAMQVFLDNVKGLFLEIGGIIRVLSNALQEMFNVAALIVNVALDPLKAKESWKHYSEEVQRDLDDMKQGAEAFQRGLVMGTNQDPNYDPAQIAIKKAERAAQDLGAVIRAEGKESSDALTAKLTGAVDLYFKTSEAKWREEKIAQEKRDKDALDAYMEMLYRKGEADRRYLEMKKNAEKDVTTYLADFQRKNDQDVQDAVERLQKEKIEGLRENIFQAVDAYTEAAYVIKDAFADLFTGGIHSAREFFQTILQGLSRIFAQMLAMKITQSVMQVVGGALGGAAGGATNWATLAGAAGASARGNVFEHGARVPFAAGGIVSGPTVFPMASGGVGLMGEAGPEAVMPLARMGNGKLGVAASMPHIQIINQTGVAATARVQNKGDRMAIVLEAAHLGASIAEDRFNRSLRSGYGTAAQSVQTVYGLRRKV